MSVTDTDRLLFKVEDMVATITLNFPEKLNAFNNEMLHAWAERLRECRDRDDVRCKLIWFNTKEALKGISKPPSPQSSRAAIAATKPIAPKTRCPVKSISIMVENMRMAMRS